MREDAAGGGFPFRERTGTGVFPLGRAFAGEPEEIRQAERKIPFAEGFQKRKQGLFAAEEPTGQAERRNRQTLFFAEESGIPQKTERPKKIPLWAARKDWTADLPKMAQMFFREMPEESGKKRQALPTAGRPAREKGHAEENADKNTGKAVREPDEKSVFQEKEERAAKRRQDTLPDIDRLMREITKRLWEEREGCGRRLGG